MKSSKLNGFHYAEKEELWVVMPKLKLDMEVMLPTWKLQQHMTSKLTSL